MIALTLLLGCYPSASWFEEQCERVGYWDGEACLGDTAAPFDTDRAFAFVASRSVTGNLAALGDAGVTDPHEVADGICNDAALAGGLEGTYQAWLSTSELDAIDHITGDGPWYTLKGVELFSNQAALKSVAQSTLWTDEFGERMSANDHVWTGTQLGGRAQATCEDWTTTDAPGNVGEPAYLADGWTDTGLRACSESFRLICFSTR